MKKFGNIAFIIAALFIILISAYKGADVHENCNECNKAIMPTQPVQFFVESGGLGLGYMISNW